LAGPFCIYRTADCSLQNTNASGYVIPAIAVLPEGISFWEKIMRSIVKERSHAVWILFAIYGLSFVLPALGSDVYGWQAFILGAMFCWLLPWSMAWWANLVFWMGLCALGIHAYGKAAVFGSIAFLLGLSFLCTSDKYQLQAGYFIWIGSMVGLLATAVCKAGQAAKESEFAPLVRRRLVGLKSALRHEPCEQIAAGPPPNRMADLHIRED
jgi:hypothetical protein